MEIAVLTGSTAPALMKESRQSHLSSPRFELVIEFEPMLLQASEECLVHLLQPCGQTVSEHVEQEPERHTADEQVGILDGTRFWIEFAVKDSI